MSEINLAGMIPAAVMPMDDEYKPAFDAYQRYIDWLINEGAIAIAINVDTGEGPALSQAERQKAIEIGAEVSNGRCSIVAGVMGSTTEAAVETALVAKNAGADALLIFPDAAYRNEPLDYRIPYNHHKAIADATEMPIVLFQLAPVFGGVLYSRDLIQRLIEIPQVVAIKDASFNANSFAYTVDTLQLADRHITLLTGNDHFILESFLLGAEGALLGFGAIGCRMVVELLDHCKKGEFKIAVDLKTKVQGFADIIYKDPVLDYRARCKVALASIGLFDMTQTYIRPPMLQLDDSEIELIKKAVIEAGVMYK